MTEVGIIKLARLGRPATVGEVRSNLSGGLPFLTREFEPTLTADLSGFSDLLGRLSNNFSQPVDSKTDAQLARELHVSLMHLDRRTLTDPLLWHWLSLEVFPRYTALRWFGGHQIMDLSTKGADGKHIIPDSEVKRFLGTASLEGVSRNSLARLFWGAETAWLQGTGSDRYESVVDVFALADLFVGVFERVLGLRPDTAIQLIQRISNRDENSRRAILTDLNLVLSTTCLEALDSDLFEELLVELIEIDDRR
jgi:hypothetical protein